MGRPCGEITSAMSRCHADLRGLGGKYVCGCAFSHSFHLQDLLSSHIFSHLVASCSTPLYQKSKPLLHLFTSSTPLVPVITSSHRSHFISTSLLLSSHLFLYLLHHFYILNHRKLTFMFYIYKLNICIFSFSPSWATRRLVVWIAVIQSPWHTDSDPHVGTTFKLRKSLQSSCGKQITL